MDDLPAARPLATERTWFVAPERTREIPARPAPVNPTGDLSLSEALDLALLQNPALEASAWHQRDRQALIEQSRIRPNPVLGMGVENFGGEDAMEGFDSARATLRISQAIELGGKRIKRIRLAQQEHALAAWDFEAQRLDLIAETGQRYLDVLAAQHNLDLATESLRSAEELHGVMTDLALQGIIPGFERDQAQVQLTARKIDEEQQWRRLASARMQLAALWDASEAEFERVVGDLHAVMPIPSYDSLLERIERNPDWARWPTEIAARQAAAKLAGSSAIPNLKIGGGIRHFNHTDTQAFVVEVGFPIPLFDRNQGARQQARLSIEEAKARQRQAQVQVTARLHELYQSLRAEHYAVTLMRDESLPAAEAAFAAARLRFDQGLTNSLQVLEAERTLIDTQYRFIAALTTYHKTLVRIESFLGESV